VALEERLAKSDTRRHETEEEFAKNRRLVKLLEKYKCELNEAQSEVQDLKNRVVDFSDLQVCHLLTPAVVGGENSLLLTPTAVVAVVFSSVLVSFSGQCFKNRCS